MMWYYKSIRVETYKYHIGGVVEEGLIISPRNRRACMKGMMNVNEVKEVWNVQNGHL